MRASTKRNALTACRWLAQSAARSLTTVGVLFTVQPVTGSEEVREIRVSAERFAFEPSRIEVETGERVRLVLTSRDVRHGFSIPELGISVPIPEGGEPAILELTLEEEGAYPFGCSEYCGAGHERMKGELVVRAAGGPIGDASRRAGQSLEEADYTLVNLPTTLAVPEGRFAFRVTHRFARRLSSGSFGDLVEDLFGLDGGAQIGLELRYGLTHGTSIGLYRTSDRTIALFGKHLLLSQEAGSPVGLDVTASLEGLDNLRRDHTPSVGVVLSRRLGERTFLYAAPAFLGNVNLTGEGDEDHSFVLGLGTRVLVTRSVAVVAEISPRLAGFDGRPGASGNTLQAAFGVEKLLGGHTFQLNFSNDLGSTPAQVARGQQGPDDWFIGFNISRRF